MQSTVYLARALICIRGRKFAEREALFAYLYEPLGSIYIIKSTYVTHGFLNSHLKSDRSPVTEDVFAKARSV